MPKPDLYTSIARDHLLIDTLEVRNMDGLDFHEVSVTGVRRALEAAYDAGRADSDQLLAAAQALLRAKDGPSIEATRRELRRAIRQMNKPATPAKP